MNTTSGRRVVIVGAGLAGLAAACHLLGRGLHVTVLERGDRPGGRAGQFVRDGFTFDTGPTVLTMPHLLADTFAAVGAQLGDQLRLQPLDPAYQAHFADGSTIAVRFGREAMAAEIRHTCGSRDEAAFHRFCAWLEQLSAVEMPHFIDRNYNHVWDLAIPPGPVLQLLRLGAFGRLHNVVSRYFHDQRLRRLFSFQALYAGLGPHQALAVYALITYMDTIGGVYYPDGGLASVATALAHVIRAAGGELRYEAGVERVETVGGTRGRVSGVRLASGESVAADAVVITTDLPVAYRDLLPFLPPPRRLQRANYSPSALVWHLGVRGQPPTGTAHHNIHFGHAWKDAFTQLLRDGQRMRDPSRLVTVPTRSDPTLAPPGCSVLYALEPVPNLDGHVDWAGERDRAGHELAEALSRFGYPVQDEVRVVDELVDPRDWERQRLARGTPFALSHRFFQSGPFRPANVDRRVPGVVFAGSATVPGVGVPMVLISGKLAADRVMEHL